MPNIIIIQPTPGPKTKERILTLIEQSPNGIIIRDICQNLNRPVSLVQQYLKMLVKERKIYAQLSENKMQSIYYAGFLKKCQSKQSNNSLGKVELR